MSVRAYKVNKIDHEHSPTFNLWHDEELCEALSVWDTMDADGCGLVDVDIETIKEVLADKDKPLEEETREALEEDIKTEEAKGNNFITYYCF